VLEIIDLTGRDHIETELVILKVEVRNEALNGFVAALRRHPRAQVIDISGGVRTIEFTGNGAEVGEFLDDLAKVGDVIELARSGTAAVERGSAVLAPAREAPKLAVAK
jgi:acetolactate synthase-1/3 small subunit